jgi:hypothetical protein
MRLPRRTIATAIGLLPSRVDLRKSDVIGALASVRGIGSVVGIIARQGPVVGVIGVMGIALLIRGVTLRARLMREEANPPRD